jgi:transcriptional regulator with XRE-family HTH domain
MTTNECSNGIGNLRTARTQSGLTREKVASLAGCSVSYLQLLEGGFNPNGSDVRPRVEQVLLEALGHIDGSHNEDTPAGNGRVRKQDAGAVHNSV